jgi:hypothetical protein
MRKFFSASPVEAGGPRAAQYALIVPVKWHFEPIFRKSPFSAKVFAQFAAKNQCRMTEFARKTEKTANCTVTHRRGGKACQNDAVK